MKETNVLVDIWLKNRRRSAIQAVSSEIFLVSSAMLIPETGLAVITLLASSWLFYKANSNYLEWNRKVNKVIKPLPIETNY